MLARAERYTTAGVVSQGPILLHGFIVAGNGAAASSELFDGTTDKARNFLSLYTVSNDSKAIILNAPIICKNGLYVKPSATTSITTVIYSELP